MQGDGLPGAPGALALPRVRARGYSEGTPHPHPGSRVPKLDEVVADVASQLADQSRLGVQITRLNDVPETGPTNKGLWYQIDDVTAVFADLKRSTKLSTEATPRSAAYAYTYFIRAMALILERFGAGYVDIQGDGVFGLFTGRDSVFAAAAAAITMRSVVERAVAERFNRDTNVEWDLAAGFGVDQGTLLVRRLGLRGTKQNEVWAGRPVNVAAKLSSLAEDNHIAVSERVFTCFREAGQARRRALLWTCGCGNGVEGTGFEMGEGETVYLWEEAEAPEALGLDFDRLLTLGSKWCRIHGTEFLRGDCHGPPTPVAVSTDERLRSHYHSLDRAIGFTKAADAKAGPLLGLQVALAGVLATQWGGLQDTLLAGPWCLERVLLAVVACLYVGILAAAVSLAMLVYIPVNPRTGKSLIYFEDVAAQDSASFQAQGKTMSPAVIEHQLLDQIHRVSVIASLKMGRVRWAFRLSAASSALWLVLLAWASVH